MMMVCAGCQSQPSEQPDKSNLTAGMAKSTIVPGTTTQAEIMEIFGPPDLVTRRDGSEIWTYDKTWYEVRSSGSYATILIVGGSQRSSSSSSVSTMMIVYFTSDDIVKDYKLSVSKF